MTNQLLNFANEYIDFYIDGKKVKIPYCIVTQKNDTKSSYTMARTDKYSNYAGKGNTDQIKKTLLNAAKNKHFDLISRKPEEITKFMISEGIGIDCSGFVFNILDKFLRTTHHISLNRLILRYPKILGRIELLMFGMNRVRRSSAAILTNDLNTIKIEKIKR